MNLLAFPGCLFPISVISFFVYAKYRGYKKRKRTAYEYLYGKKEYNNYLKNKKDDTCGSAFKYRNLRYRDIKKAIWNREFDLKFRYEYGDKAFRKFDSYRKGYSDFTEKEMCEILEMERDIKELMKYNRSVTEIEKYIED